jgi:hypothetical protein
MRKYIYILIILTVTVLSGCKKEDKMPDFIPTQSSEDDIDYSGEESDANEDIKQSEDGDIQEGDIQDEDVSEKDEASPTQPIVIGKTTTMYVKLSQYGGSLNIRPKPSTDGEPVGFLVHAEAVDVIEIKDGWASFLYNGAICYVNADFMVDKRPAYLDPPTATPKPSATPTPAPDKPRDI